MRMSRTLFILAIGGPVLVTLGTLLWPATSSANAGARVQEPQQEQIRYIGNGRFLSNAVRVGNTLYLSGQLGISGERGITPETRAALENIKSLLEANGATMDDVVKCTVFLADFAEWGAMNEVYTTYFAKHRPARSAVAVSGLAANARVEIECMAVIGARNAS
ncbi:MAG TPA: RidA family protein [Longimicrobiales bacterium]